MKLKLPVGKVVALGIVAFGSTCLVGSTPVSANQEGSAASFIDVGFTTDGVCVLTDKGKELIKNDEVKKYKNGDVGIIQESYGGTKLGGPVGWRGDTNRDGKWDFSRKIGFFPGRCK